jgi:uncharacterized protein YjdB
MKRNALVAAAVAVALAIAGCTGLLDTPVSGVALNEYTTTIGVGLAEQLTASIAPAGATNPGVTWASSDAGKATVSATGLVTGMAAGTTTVTVTTGDGGFTAACVVTVAAATVAVTGVTLDKASASLAVGNTVQLTATIAPAAATNQDVTWASSDAAKATVSATGLVTALASGSTTITVATVDGLMTATCAVSVVTVYAAGFSMETGGIKVAGYWKNGVWTGLAPEVAGESAQVNSLAVSASDVYAAGFSNNASVPRSGMWTNGVWAGGGAPPGPAQGTTVVLSGGHLYTGGWATFSGVRSGGYARDGVGAGLPMLDPAHDAAVNTVFVVADVIYAGGYSTDASNVQVAGYWTITGTTPVWTGLTPLSASHNSQVYSVAVSGTDVYAAGFSTTAGNAMTAGYWRNGTWQELPRLDPTRNSAVNSIFVAGSDVYAGGYSTVSDGAAVTVVAGVWKNGVWTALPAQTGLPQ